MKNRKCILVSDNGENYIDTIVHMLVESDYDVITAKNGQEVLEYLKEKSCDLILSDITMSDMSGIELLERVNTMDSSIGVIIVTNHGDVRSYLESMTKGAFEYITTPIRTHELSAIVKKYFRSSNCSGSVVNHLMAMNAGAM